MWTSILVLTPYVAIASSLVVITAVVSIVISQPARQRAAGFAA